MKTEALGIGCYKCVALDPLMAQVLADIGGSDIIPGRVDDGAAIRKIMPLQTTAGLVVDGHLVHSGSLPSKDDLRDWLVAT